MDSKKDLIRIYSRKSKHSNYQALPNDLQKIISTDKIQTRPRFDAERLGYILKKIDVSNKSILDIGSNTGYFSFELIKSGAKNAHCYEGNEEHANFIKMATQELGQSEKIKVSKKYFEFNASVERHYDIALLLNVLHHIGDDYGPKKITITTAKQLILEQLNYMSKICDTLVFQLGFNWQGDINRSLFKNGTKREMINYIENGTSTSWTVEAIGIAQKKAKSITYTELNGSNIERDDSLGEFLNRPIFIMKSKYTSPR